MLLPKESRKPNDGCLAQMPGVFSHQLTQYDSLCHSFGLLQFIVFNFCSIGPISFFVCCDVYVCFSAKAKTCQNCAMVVIHLPFECCSLLLFLVFLNKCNGSLKKSDLYIPQPPANHLFHFTKLLFFKQIYYFISFYFDTFE